MAGLIRVIDCLLFQTKRTDAPTVPSNQVLLHHLPLI